MKIEWNPEGHANANEGPHVTVRNKNEKGGWSVIAKFFIEGMDFLSNMMNWNEFNDKMVNVFGRTFCDVDDLYFNVIKEKRFSEFIELDDKLALSYLKELCPIKGEICVITDLCYKKGYGPFVMQAIELDNFVESFELKYGESFYSTDIIIVNFECQMIWVLFHEGICWLSKI